VITAVASETMLPDSRPELIKVMPVRMERR
jgi:hypothetical protein